MLTLAFNRTTKTALLFLILAGVVLARLFVFCSGSLGLAECGDKIVEESRKSSKETLTDKYCLICNKYRQNLAAKIRSLLPSPHSELLLGTTLGINALDTIPRFNDVLVSTGTIHVVVVSGFNISLVFNHISNLLKRSSPKTRLFISQLVAIIYALLTGFEPPVVRALLTVSVIFWVRFFGRNTNVYAVLFLTALLMLVFNPLYLFSLSFQLSFLATLGLVIFSDPIESFLTKYFGENIIISDFSASLSAQILVTPLISHVFGRVSVLSALVNSIVLWLIPLITMVGMLVVIGIAIHEFIGMTAALIFLPLSLLFVNLLEFMDKIFSLNLTLQMSSETLITYYILLGFLSLYLINSSKKLEGS